MKQLRFAVLAALVAACIAPMARADYAVLRSGAKIHITGYRNPTDA
jgi:hypothetical protein